MGVISEDELAGLQMDYALIVGPMIADAMEYGARKKQALDRARFEEFEADDRSRQPNRTFAAGDRVVFTGKALNSMGSTRGVDSARVWEVLECACDLCRLGRHVCTDQSLSDGSGWRHIANSALRLKSQSSVDDIDNLPPELCGKSIDVESLFKNLSYPHPRAPEAPSAPGSLAVLLDQLAELELGRKERMR